MGGSVITKKPARGGFRELDMRWINLLVVLSSMLAIPALAQETKPACAQEKVDAIYAQMDAGKPGAGKAERDEARRTKQVADDCEVIEKQATQLPPGAHRRGDAITNAPCDEVERMTASENSGIPSNKPVDVAIFTPIEWQRSTGVTPWEPLGKTESKAFFFTVAARNYDTYINIKMATKGPGDDYVAIDFITSELDCRPGSGYPAGLSSPTTYSYTGSGIPHGDDYRAPFGQGMVAGHGTVLAKAIIAACDEVRAANGNLHLR
jgi:hypothetical protein